MEAPYFPDVRSHTKKSQAQDPLNTPYTELQRTSTFSLTTKRDHHTAPGTSLRHGANET